MPVGGTITYTRHRQRQHAAATGTLSNTATVTPPSSETDTNLNNNSATDTDNLTSTSGPLAHGDTATIGFWHNKNGQGLILGATPAAGAPTLANFLATTFPYLYGANAPSGNNLTNASNATVAALFTTFFNVKGQNTDAQVMGGALAMWFTSSSLNGNTSAAHGFGFNISAGGTGAKTYNVGSLGTAIGLQNNTSYSILKLLQQANLDRMNGTFNANAFNTIFDGINSGRGHQLSDVGARPKRPRPPWCQGFFRSPTILDPRRLSFSEVMRGRAVMNPAATLDASAVRMAVETKACSAFKVILSFDVEEHFRIEAAAGLSCAPSQKTHHRERLDVSTNWVLDLLAEAQAKATFFIVGEIAEFNPTLIRRIAQEGHEVASHGWDHRRIHHFFTPTSFREDVNRSKGVLEDLSGEAVVGYRAPTFSITRDTAWALDVLADLGMVYDSSIYPVRHDRYGVPSAPRFPFMARGEKRALLELPPATLRLGALNVPMGGGGYFRLFPLSFTRWAVRQMNQGGHSAIANLYFHPWEFDPDQSCCLPLGRLDRFRTYVGIRRSRGRLTCLLKQYSFSRAVDVAQELLDLGDDSLPSFEVSNGKKHSPGLWPGKVAKCNLEAVTERNLAPGPLAGKSSEM